MILTIIKKSSHNNEATNKCSGSKVSGGTACLTLLVERMFSSTAAKHAANSISRIGLSNRKLLRKQGSAKPHRANQ